jgi:alkylation response protein AidB-like acyl-CoA dehydrogenase
VITSSLVSEKLGRQGSFGVSHGAHTGIGTLPLVYFGNEQQKKKYLPKLATGEFLGAYALSETTSGSDALSAKTRAVLSSGGSHYVLNGEKMWTSNGGFADLITIFAQVDGDKFTAFLVERTFPGVSTGREEHKLGIKGSSTVRIILEDARVPRENLLHEVGRGHIVALNILNICRFKLAVGLLGAAKDTLSVAARYAKERKQFARSISEFGLIQHKLGEMATRLFASESACYRVGGLIQARLDQQTGTDRSASKNALSPQVAALEEYIVECAMMKVQASEMLDYIVDEAVQIHGGYGYTEEFPVARAYRDSRINRIFEGTNEINRLVIPGTLMRRAEKKRLPIMPAIMRLQNEILSSPSSGEDFGSDLLADARRCARDLKKLVLLTSATAVQKYTDAIQDQQEILGALADMVIAVFVLESALLRTDKHLGRLAREGGTSPMIAATRVLAAGAVLDCEARLREVLAAITEGDDLRAQLAVMRRFTRALPVDTIQLRREVARAVLERDGYPFA